MKTATPFVVLMIALLSNSCKKKDGLALAPPCIHAKIQTLLLENCPSVKSVHQYRFKGNTVYLFSPKDCGADTTSDVYDASCNIICSLGGFSGDMLCYNTDFYQSATNKKWVWGEK